MLSGGASEVAGGLPGGGKSDLPVSRACAVLSRGGNFETSRREALGQAFFFLCLSGR